MRSSATRVLAVLLVCMAPAALAVQDSQGGGFKCPNQKALLQGESRSDEGEQLCASVDTPPIEFLCPTTRLITPSHQGLCSPPGSAPGFECVADGMVMTLRCPVSCGANARNCPTGSNCTPAFQSPKFKTVACPEKPSDGDQPGGGPPDETPGEGPPSDTPGNGPPTGG